MRNSVTEKKSFGYPLSKETIELAIVILVNLHMFTGISGNILDKIFTGILGKIQV